MTTHDLSDDEIAEDIELLQIADEFEGKHPVTTV